MSENSENIQKPNMNEEISGINMQDDCDHEEVENVSENIHDGSESEDSDEVQPIEENQPVKKEPPSYGSFTKFTIDHILNSEDPCKNRRSDLSHRLDVPTNESTGNKFVSSWITNGFARLSKTSDHAFQFPGFPQEQCSESPSSSDSDEASLEIHSERTDERMDDSASSPTNDQHSEYSWLHCTRYKPPKLPSEFYCSVNASMIFLPKTSVHLISFSGNWYKFNLSHEQFLELLLFLAGSKDSVIILFTQDREERMESRSGSWEGIRASPSPSTRCRVWSRSSCR